MGHAYNEGWVHLYSELETSSLFIFCSRVRSKQWLLWKPIAVRLATGYP